MDVAPHNQLTTERASATMFDDRTDARDLPIWFREYLMERRRALLTELRQIEKALNIAAK